MGGQITLRAMVVSEEFKAVLNAKVGQQEAEDASAVLSEVLSSRAE